jgi:hypothetical protein
LQEFECGKFGIVFISRGRGRGHAVPDMAIAHELMKLVRDIDIRFVSYSGGAEAFRSCGHSVIDLGMPDEPNFLDMIIYEARVVGHLAPALVVAHEEFAALPAARIFEVPCVFITDFFQDPNSMPMRALLYAVEVIFTSEAGIFTEPPYLRSKIRYVGPAVRRFEYRRCDRDRARRELGIPSDATVILCQPGNWPESQVPTSELVARAFGNLPYTDKRLIWLAGHDYNLLASRFAEQAEIIVLKEDWKIDRLIVASDLVLTKSNRLTVYEAASMGAPTVSISNGSNWPDDVAVAHVPSNTVLELSGAKSEDLTRLMASKIAAGWIPAVNTPQWEGVALTALSLAEHIARIRREPDARIASAADYST